MSARYYDTLANLELATVQQRYRQLVFVDNLPLMGLTVRNLAEKAGIAYWHWERHVDSYLEFGAKQTAAMRHQRIFSLILVEGLLTRAKRNSKTLGTPNANFRFRLEADRAD